MQKRKVDLVASLVSPIKIDAFIVCVDYSDYLRLSINRWSKHMRSVTVITSSVDVDTHALAQASNVRLYVTNVFYAGGAMFNKGAAIAEAYVGHPYGAAADVWRVMIDADVIPPEDWYDQLCRVHPCPGNLYGARRMRADGSMIDDRELAGFFQLWHSDDPHGRRPVSSDFIHAGNYDSEFMLRWPVDRRIITPITMLHLGETGTNWCGRRNDAAMARLRERRKRWPWRNETLKNVTKYC